MATTTAGSRFLLTLASPADAARSRWLQIVAPWLGRMLVDRHRRIALGLSLSIIVSLLLTLVAPIGLLAIGPLLWGVPHVVSDVRYLVVRPGLHRRVAVWIAIGAPLAMTATTTLGVRAGAFGLLGAAIVARGSTLIRRAILACTSLGAVAVAWRFPREADLLFAHLHNLVALAFVWTFRPRNARLSVGPFALFATITALLLMGLFDAPIDAMSGWTTHTGLMLGPLLRAFAPFPTHLVFARRLLLSFAFAQSVHYAIWLRAIPDEARPGSTPRSFRQSVRAIVREMGATLPLAALAASVALALWALSDLVAARDGYLRFAVFHGHMEIAVAGILWAEKQRA